MRPAYHSLLILILAANPPGAATAPAQQIREFRYGPYVTVIEGLIEPAGVAIDRNERIYVADSGNHRVAVFDATGKPIRSWGSFGSEPGQFAYARGLALGPEGNVFVADTGNHRVQVFTAGGELVSSWGERGTAPGQFQSPEGIAVTADRVFVADTGNDRIQVFSRSGTFESIISGDADKGESFHRPVDVATDSDGSVFVADLDDSRIRKFDAKGEFVRAWGEWGSFGSMLAGPIGLTLFGDELHVADFRNHRVQVYDLEGQARFDWGKHVLRPHEGEGRIHYPTRVAVAPSGEFAVISESFENRCQIIAQRPDGYEQAPWQPTWADEGTANHYGSRADTDGEYLVIPEPDTHSVLMFDTSGKTPIMITQVGGPGRGFGRFIHPTDVEVDKANGRLYVLDGGNSRLQIFGFQREPGEHLRFEPSLCRFIKAADYQKWSDSLAAANLQWAFEPVDMERDHAGYFYFLDSRNARVLKFDAHLKFVSSWGSYGTGPGEFVSPTTIAIHPSGEPVYVVDAGAHRVSAYTNNGVFLHSWGGRGSGHGEFQMPWGIVARADGSIYVTDSILNRVQRFDPTGKWVASWGSDGLSASEFFKPRGIIRDSRDRLLVIDYGNHRGQYFSPDGEFLHAFGARWYVQPTRSKEKATP